MGKIIIIGIAVLLLYLFIARKFSKFKFDNSGYTSPSLQNIEITVPTFMLQQLFKKVLLTVGTGFLLLIIILVIASKFKVALLLLPISFYLIGQFFVFNNHIKTIKNQKLLYNKVTATLTISIADQKPFTINFDTDSYKVREVKSVQKNNGVLMGYFELISNRKNCFIPYIVSTNPQTKPFFDKLLLSKRELETKLFPII